MVAGARGPRRIGDRSGTQLRSTVSETRIVPVLCIRRSARRAAVMISGLAGLSLLARQAALDTGPLVVLVALMPFVALAAVVGLALSLLARAWGVVAVSVVLTTLCTLTQVRVLIPATAESTEGTSIVLLTLNMSGDAADADQVVGLARQHSVDVLALQEVGPSQAERLADAGLDEMLTYRREADYGGSDRVELWSRYPILASRALPGFVWPQLETTVDLPRVGPTSVLSLHPLSPGLFVAEAWRREQRILYQHLSETDGPVIVAGDLNSTRDHPLVRRLEAVGYREASDQAGRGYLMTWPVGLGMPGPVFGIDHVLTKGGIAVTDAQVGPSVGSDHSPVIATLLVEPPSDSRGSRAP